MPSSILSLFPREAPGSNTDEHVFPEWGWWTWIQGGLDEPQLHAGVGGAGPSPWESSQLAGLAIGEDRPGPAGWEVLEDGTDQVLQG